MKIKGYRAEVRSKYNHALFNVSDLRQTESAARRAGQRLLKKERFNNEKYVEVVRIEEHIL